MNRFIRQAFLFALILFSTVFTGQNAKAAHEIPFGISPMSLGGNSTALGFSLGYFLTLNPLVQAGAQAFYNSTTARGTSASQLAVLIGPKFNFLPYPEAITAQVGFAVRRSSGTPESSTATDGTTLDDPKGVGFGLLVSKRFPLTAQIQYQPTVGFLKTGTFGFVLAPFQFSYSF